MGKRKAFPMVNWIIVLSGYWLLMVWWASCLGVYSTEFSADSQLFFGYLYRPNWMVFPLFWLLSLTLLHHSWSQFAGAWREMFLQGRVQMQGRYKIASLPRDEASLACDQFLCSIKTHRKWVATAAVLLALIVMILDTANLWKVYHLEDQVSSSNELTIQLNTFQFDYAGSKGVFLKSGETHKRDGKSPALFAVVEKEALNKMCGELKVATKINIYAMDVDKEYRGLYSCPEKNSRIFSGPIRLNVQPFKSELSGKVVKLDRDWTEAWIWGQSVDRTENALFVVFSYLQQFILFAVGWAVLIILICHAGYFKQFERLALCQKHGWVLRLDASSNLREFGLERWNMALNNIYWIISLVILIPLMSKWSQPPGSDDIGQVMIRLIIPFLLILPMILARA